MRGPAIQPDHDAVDLPAAGLARTGRNAGRVRLQTKQAGQANPQGPANAELQEIPARHARAIMGERAHGVLRESRWSQSSLRTSKRALRSGIALCTRIGPLCAL